MEYGLYDITSATTTTLIASGGRSGAIKTMSICNQHSSSSIDVDLFLDDGKGNADSDCYIIKNLTIPAGVTLFLDDGISFDNSTLDLKLTTTGSGLPVSVIIK